MDPLRYEMDPLYKNDRSNFSTFNDSIEKAVREYVENEADKIIEEHTEAFRKRLLYSRNDIVATIMNNIVMENRVDNTGNGTIRVTFERIN